MGGQLNLDQLVLVDNTPEQMRAAAAFVRSGAQDEADADHLLMTLGLIPSPPPKKVYRPR